MNKMKKIILIFVNISKSILKIAAVLFLFLIMLWGNYLPERENKEGLVYIPQREQSIEENGISLPCTLDYKTHTAGAPFGFIFSEGSSSCPSVYLIPWGIILNILLFILIIIFYRKIKNKVIKKIIEIILLSLFVANINLFLFWSFEIFLIFLILTMLSFLIFDIRRSFLNVKNDK